MKGTLVVKGYRIPITDLRLRNGRLQMSGWFRGPLPELVDEPVTIFGEDGTGFAQGGKFSVRAIGESEMLEAMIEMSMDRINE